MKIKKSLPLAICEKCTDCRPYTNDNKIYGVDNVVEQVITVGCEYEKQCALIYNALKAEEKGTEVEG